MSTCPECDIVFSRKDAMLRHKRNRHEINQPYPQSTGPYPPPLPPPSPPPPPPPPPQLPLTTLQHPFTMMMLAGPTGSGKTYWMKQLLERAKTMIKPSPQRIIWCYKRWQPMFDEIKFLVKNILFVQGIPDDLNDDSFIDTRYPSLIVIDDLMKDATNSKDVCEIFVEGSHHRNLSVACLVQNAFSKGKENRTMSINSQYMVLFKNPRDQVVPSIFARQMYPNNPKKFMNKYIEGTRRPYGYLFIDFKQTTPEDERLKTDIFEGASRIDSIHHPLNTVGGGVNQYKRRSISEITHFDDTSQSDQTYPPEERDNSTIDTKLQTEYLLDNKETMPSCDECGLMFESVHDLARHMNRWCPENNDLKRKREDDVDEYISKKSRFEEEPVMKEEEEEVFLQLAKQSREANEDRWESKVEKYVKDGLTEKEAIMKADRKYKDDDMDQLMSRYGILLKYTMQLKNGKLHAKVVKSIKDLVGEGMDYQKAIKLSIRKYKHMLEDYLDNAIEIEEDDRNSDDSDDNDDDEEEEEAAEN